jgi:hypothetical protein
MRNERLSGRDLSFLYKKSYSPYGSPLPFSFFSPLDFNLRFYPVASDTKRLKVSRIKKQFLVS